MSGFRGFEPDGLVNLALWQSAQADLGQDGDPSGTALAVGWTREWEPAFKVDGNERRAPGRTAVVGRAPVTAVDGRLTDMAIDIDVVRGPAINPFHGRFAGAVNGGEPSLVKVTLPAGYVSPPAPPDGRRLPPGRGGRHLALRSTLPLSAVAVWHDGAWQHLEVPFGVNDLDAVLRFKRGIAINGGGIAIQPALPPGAVTTTTAPLPPDLAPGAVPVPPRPVPFPADGVLRAGGFPVDVALPEGVGTGGVVFLRLVVDQTSLSGDATFSLVEVVR